MMANYEHDDGGQAALPKHETFETWWEAFDVCRERDRPIVARVDSDGSESGVPAGTEISKIYPSGRGVVLLSWSNEAGSVCGWAGSVCGWTECYSANGGKADGPGGDFDHTMSS